MEAQPLTPALSAGSASTHLFSFPGTILGAASRFFGTRGCQAIPGSLQFQSLQETIQLLSPLTCGAQRLLGTCHPLLHLPWVGPGLKGFMQCAPNLTPLVSREATPGVGSALCPVCQPLPPGWHPEQHPVPAGPPPGPPGLSLPSVSHPQPGSWGREGVRACQDQDLVSRRGRQGAGSKVGDQTVPAARRSGAALPGAHLPQCAPGSCPHLPGSGPALRSHPPAAGSAQVMLEWRVLAPGWPPSQCCQGQPPPLWGHRQGLKVRAWAQGPNLGVWTQRPHMGHGFASRQTDVTTRIRLYVGHRFGVVDFGMT